MIVIDWLIANAGSIAVGSLVLGAVIAIVVYKVLSRKKGKSSCGCGCSECPMSGKCYKQD